MIISRNDRIEMADKARESMKADKYTKQKFLEELEQAKKDGTVVMVHFLALFADLRLASIRCSMDRLEDALGKLDDDMMFTNESSDFLMVLNARFDNEE